MIIIPEQYHDVWNNLVRHYHLSERQQEQIWTFLNRLISENEKYNLTAIVELHKAIHDHVYDSLALLDIFDRLKATSIADIGSGGGFPGIPLAIALPDVRFTLVEVNLKKVAFLESVAADLGLTNVHVVSYDFRTFLRQFDKPIELFIARASLEVDEILRIFKPSSQYQASTFVYWASSKWVATGSLQKLYFDNCYPYSVENKQRALCVFIKKENGSSKESLNN